jgi:K+-transporting ATPase KdpF subunit
LSRPATRCEGVMIWLTVSVLVFLFLYLLAALLRPEWF